VPDPSEWLDPVTTLRGGVPEWIGLDEFERLLAAADAPTRRALCLGAWAGLRISEAAAAHWRDLDREQMLLRVTSKGRVRLVGVSPVLVDSLLPDTRANIVTGSEPLTPAGLQRRLAKVFAAADVDGSFHRLRHRYGMMALAGTDDIAAVARAMGHASTDTTRLYAAAADSQLHKIAEAVTRRADVTVTDDNATRR
jgi:integrase/recombinase XerD